MLLAAAPGRADIQPDLAPPPVAASTSLHVEPTGLPAILAIGDVVLYRRAATAQQAGDWRLAERLLGAVIDRRLVGRMAAARLLDPRYHATFGELRDWLARYADHPEAAEIHRLALRRAPAGAAGGETGLDIPKRALDSAGPAAPADPLRTDAADGAIRADQQSVRAEPNSLNWTAGLTAWRADRKATALEAFVAVANAPQAPGWTVSAGAFWAARAARALGRASEADRWLARAADMPYTFYGLLACRLLRHDAGFDWRLPSVRDRDVADLERYPGVIRAIELVQIEQRQLAEDEIRLLADRLPSRLKPSMVTIAERGGMPALAMKLGGQMQSRGMHADAALYPLPPWIPETGFSLNPALLYAFAREESEFNPEATSARGAAGLMQLMPGTAQSVAAPSGAPPVGLVEVGEAVYDPTASLTMAQRLIARLLASDRVGDNLFKLAVAYNSGEVGLFHIQGAGGAKERADPLLFLETLPARDTRAYVHHVLTNFWIYQIRLGQQPDSLDAMARGSWPFYRATGHSERIAQGDDRAR